LVLNKLIKYLFESVSVVTSYIERSVAVYSAAAHTTDAAAAYATDTTTTTDSTADTAAIITWYTRKSQRRS
jgi:hypothetical protein